MGVIGMCHSEASEAFGGSQLVVVMTSRAVPVARSGDLKGERVSLIGVALSELQC